MWLQSRSNRIVTRRKGVCGCLNRSNIMTKKTRWGIRDKLVKREKGQVEALRDTIRNSQAAQVYFTISARQFGIRRRRTQQTTNCCYRCSITPTFSNGFIMTNSSQVLVIDILAGSGQQSSTAKMTLTSQRIIFSSKAVTISFSWRYCV